MTTLDFEALSSLIESLRMARQTGFSSSSSPIVPLLEASIDITLSLRNAIKDIQFIADRTRFLNKDPIFLKGQYDFVGNTKTISVSNLEDIKLDFESGWLFNNLASLYIELKRGVPADKAVMAFIGWCAPFLPPTHEAFNAQVKEERPARTGRKQSKRKARNAYFRRHRIRSTK